MKIRISGVANDSIVDGPGLRYTIFTQGCPHNCKGCHNPQTHDMGGGKLIDTCELVEEFRKNPLLDGITFSGGEPFCQPEALAEIACEAKKIGLDIVTYTGYTFEYLMENADKCNDYMRLLSLTDILIDGKFIIEQRTLDEAFKGSMNQRILDCQESIKTRTPVDYKI